MELLSRQYQTLEYMLWKEDGPAITLKVASNLEAFAFEADNFKNPDQLMRRPIPDNLFFERTRRFTTKAREGIGRSEQEEYRNRDGVGFHRDVGSNVPARVEG